MQDGKDSVASLREKANKCRLLADHMLDKLAAASLRDLAMEYDEAANAVGDRSVIYLDVR